MTNGRDGETAEAMGDWVPPGTTATLYVPASTPAAVTEGGRPVAQAAGVRSAGVEDGKALFTVGSGQYAFATKFSR